MSAKKKTYSEKQMHLARQAAMRKGYRIGVRDGREQLRSELVHLLKEPEAPDARS